MCLLVLHPLKLWLLLLKQIEVLPVLDNVQSLQLVVGNHSESIRSSAVTNWQLNLYSSGSDVSARVKYFTKDAFDCPHPQGKASVPPEGLSLPTFPCVPPLLCHLGPSPVLKTSWVLYRPSVREVQIVSIFPDVAAVRQSSV